MIAHTKTLVIGTTLLLGSGFAVADEPMVLTVGQMDTVTAGGGIRGNSSWVIRTNFNRWINEHKNARNNVVTHVVNNSAAADATADSFGSNTDAQTFTYAQTTHFSSEAASLSIALTGR